MPAPAAPTRYLLHVGGHRYVLTVAGRARRTLELAVDGTLAARATSMDEHTTLHPGDGLDDGLDDGPAHGRDGDSDGDGDRSHGRTGGDVPADARRTPEAPTSTGATASAPWRAVEVRCTRAGRVRRATVRTRDGRELDLDPEPGSAAAARLARERAHPVLFGVLSVLVAAAKVLLPLLGLGALARAFVEPAVAWVRERLPHVDLPDLPSIPWPHVDLPDIPSIPWPDVDLPDIPWPDWTPPGWLVWTLDHADMIWPLLLAAGLARAEVTRRRTQDAVKAQLAERERRDLLRRLHADLDELARQRGGSPEHPGRTAGAAAAPGSQGSSAASRGPLRTASTESGARATS